MMMITKRSPHTFAFYGVALAALVSTSGCGGSTGGKGGSQSPDVTAPTVVSTGPARNASGVATNSQMSATFSEPMDPSSINRGTFIVTRGEEIAGTVSYSNAGQTATFSPTQPLLSGVIYTGHVSNKVKDLAGNFMAVSYSFSFRTAAGPDLTAPVVTSMRPAAGSTGVSIGAVVEATFDEPIDSSTLNMSTFRLLGPGMQAVPGSVTYTDTTRTARFTATSGLAGSTMYTAMVLTGVADIAGNPLASEVVWTFVTGPAAPIDTTAPTVISSVPANNATGVATSSIVTATFSESVSSSSVNSTTFTVSNGADIAGLVTYTDAGRTATFAPSQDLLPATVYTASVGTGVRDLANNALAAAFTFTFTTAAAPDTTPPLVSSVTPAPNASGVAINSKVNATFSESIDPSTITTATFELSRPGQTPVPATVTYVELSGIATLTPLGDLLADTLYTGTLKTGVRDLAGNALASDFVWTFRTAVAPDTTPPVVISSIPADGAVDVATNSRVTVTFSEPMDPASISAATFSVATGASITGLVTYADAGRTATFAPSQDLLPATVYTVSVGTSVTDLAGNALAAALTFSFTTAAAPDTTPPLVSSVTPAPNATGVAINARVNATFSESIDLSTITTATFELSSSGQMPVPATVTYVDLTSIATLTPLGDLLADTLYTGTLKTGVRDLAGNALASDFVWTFRTAVAPDTTPPVVISSIPADGAVDVATNSRVTVTFSESMDPASISAATFSLASGASVTGLVSYTDAGRTATFAPSQDLLPATVYAASVGTGVTDLAGNALAAAFSFSFTTAAAPDTTPPLVSSVTPAPNVTGVPINARVNATFSESIDLSTITTATFELSSSGQTPVPATVTYVDLTSIATLTPLGDLLADTLYTGTLKTGVRDLAGNALASDFVWTFRTAVAPDTTPPFVQLTSPDDGATAVATNSSVSATFSESMDPSTITLMSFTVSSGSAITGLVSYTDVGRTATFVPDQPLLFNTVYDARVTTEVRDLAGNAMLLDFDWSFTTGLMPDLIAPTVTLTHPVDGATNVHLDKSVSATFSEPIDPLSIDALSFTLVGTSPVQGTVAYDSMSRIATFVPMADLSPNTLYTATLTTDIVDLAGNGLLLDFEWTFMTGLNSGVPPVDLASAGQFAVLAGSTVSSTGPTVLNGDLGLSPGTAIAGFPPGQVNGMIHAGDPIAATAKGELTTAFNDAQGRSTGAISLPGNLGGLTLTPGLYSNSSTVMISGTGPLGILTLDAQGDASAVFILKMSSTLTTDPGTSIVLSGGAKAGNIYWSVGTSATLGTNSVFYGNILADQSITLETGATLNGRALTRIAAVTLDAATITVPSP